MRAATLAQARRALQARRPYSDHANAFSIQNFCLVARALAIINQMIASELKLIGRVCNRYPTVRWEKRLADRYAGDMSCAMI